MKAKMKERLNKTVVIGDFTIKKNLSEKGCYECNDQIEKEEYCIYLKKKKYNIYKYHITCFINNMEAEKKSILEEKEQSIKTINQSKKRVDRLDNEYKNAENWLNELNKLLEEYHIIEDLVIRKI